jgi:hypothetical protein
MKAGYFLHLLYLSGKKRKKINRRKYFINGMWGKKIQGRICGWILGRWVWQRKISLIMEEDYIPGTSKNLV